MAKVKKIKSQSAVAQAKGQRRPQFPAHIGMTEQQWRGKKRMEWLEVMQSLDRFRYGSAYAPGNRQMWEIDKFAAELQELIESPDWVAW